MSKVGSNARNTLLMGKPGSHTPSLTLNAKKRLKKDKLKIAKRQNTTSAYTLLLEREPEYPVKITPLLMGREETADKKKKRETDKDTLVDKAEKQHEEEFQKLNAKLFGG